MIASLDNLSKSSHCQKALTQLSYVLSKSLEKPSITASCTNKTKEHFIPNIILNLMMQMIT